MRREQDRPAPRRRRACYDDFWHFVPGQSNPQRLRCARAVLEVWFNGAVTRTLFCAGEEGLSGDTAPVSYHASLVFIELLTVPGGGR